jgi:tetratricopeptide (TPR) repeat protein
LADANLNMPRPDLQRALEENRRYLATARLSAGEREQGILQEAQILFRLGRMGECTAALDRMPADSVLSGEVWALRGRILYHQAESLRNKTDPTAEDKREATAKYGEAIQVFRKAQSRDTVSNQATRQAMYLAALCQVALGRHEEALAELARTNTLFAGTFEGQAASFQEAKLALRLGKDVQALAAYRRLLSSLSDPASFRNPWFSLNDLRSSVLAVHQDYRAAQKYQAALQLARMATALFGAARSTELMAEVRRSWAESLHSQAAGLPPQQAENTRREARKQSRLAGTCLDQLAELERASRRYPEVLWQAANVFLEGQDYPNAVRLLRKYLEVELRQHHAQALVMLGEARMALGQWDKALDAFQQCIDDHPRDAAGFRARLMAAKVRLEKGDLKQAESLLRASLDGDQLTPASKEWRDSLFTLGELLHAQRRYADAVRRLDEAVTRYPDSPQAVPACYLAADAALRGALALKEQTAKDLTLEARRAHAEQSRQLMERASGAYQEVAEKLSRRDTAAMTAPQRAMLRNSRFAIAEIQAELGQYDAAIRQYTAIVNGYSDLPEVLDAYVELSCVYRRLERSAEARTSIEQAKFALARLKDDAALAATTNFSRQEWSEVLERLSNL